MNFKLHYEWEKQEEGWMVGDLGRKGVLGLILHKHLFMNSEFVGDL